MIAEMIKAFKLVLNNVNNRDGRDIFLAEVFLDMLSCSSGTSLLHRLFMKETYRGYRDLKVHMLPCKAKKQYSSEHKTFV